MAERERSEGRRPLLIAALLGAAVLLAGVIVLAIGARRAEPSAPGSFYAIPSPLPTGPPGTVIRSEPVASPPAGARAWRILYLSRSYTGRPTALSALIFVPTAPARTGGRRVVSFTHGTVGVAPGCAPSLLGPSYFGHVDGLTAFIRAGDVVVAPDYQGLGTPGPHPYLVGASEARSALDAVRAAHRFPPAEAGTTYAVWGASQGGHAALFAGQVAASYAPELTLAGVAAAAPATDLRRLFELNRDTTFGRLLSAYTLAMWSRVYPGLRLEDVVTRPARPVVRRLARLCLTGGGLANTVALGAFTTLLRVTYLRRPPWETPGWAPLLARNSPGAAPIRAPVDLVQGLDDPLVRPAVTRAYVRRLCARGTRVSYREYPGLGHVEAGPRTAADVARWIADRFAGRPAPSTCG